MDWFLYYRDLRRERVKVVTHKVTEKRQFGEDEIVKFQIFCEHSPISLDIKLTLFTY